jgi:hypothetical protein
MYNNIIFPNTKSNRRFAQTPHPVRLAAARLRSLPLTKPKSQNHSSSIALSSARLIPKLKLLGLTGLLLIPEIDPERSLNPPSPKAKGFALGSLRLLGEAGLLD